MAAEVVDSSVPKQNIQPSKKLRKSRLNTPIYRSRTSHGRHIEKLGILISGRSVVDTGQVLDSDQELASAGSRLFRSRVPDHSNDVDLSQPCAKASDTTSRWG